MAKDIRVKAHLSAPIKANAGLGQTVVVGGTNLRPATKSTLGGVIVGEDLDITSSGVLSIIKADRAEQDNTDPITAAAVYTEVGNINALLQTI